MVIKSNFIINWYFWLFMFFLGGGGGGIKITISQKIWGVGDFRSRGLVGRLRGNSGKSSGEGGY